MQTYWKSIKMYRKSMENYLRSIRLIRKSLKVYRKIMTNWKCLRKCGPRIPCAGAPLQEKWV